ncbi:MAG: hypothetical protein AAF198_03425 [Pseudomonadota bacterium]
MNLRWYILLVSGLFLWALPLTAQDQLDDHCVSISEGLVTFCHRSDVWLDPQWYFGDDGVFVSFATQDENFALAVSTVTNLGHNGVIVDELAWMPFFLDIPLRWLMQNIFGVSLRDRAYNFEGIKVQEYFKGIIEGEEYTILFQSKSEMLYLSITGFDASYTYSDGPIEDDPFLQSVFSQVTFADKQFDTIRATLSRSNVEDGV